MYHKKMPSEAAEQLTQVERLMAHINDGYEVLPEDAAYFEEISQTFRIIFDAETPEQARRKMVAILGKKRNLSKLIDDTVAVYGDFFLINKNALRVIQEKRHLYVYKRALADGDNASAEKALTAIDKLYHLYSKEDELPTSAQKLPKIERSSDPRILELQNNGSQ